MKILLTNDDGYLAEGIVLLCSSLSVLGHEVYVVAPDGQRSGFSHSATIYKDIVFNKIDNYTGAKLAYSCSGSPADCVKFAESSLNIKFDLLISGPNNGENYGNAILYSGTVAAAEEGVLCGIKSIAVSRIGFGGSYGSTIEYICNNLQELCRYEKKNCFLNINVPNLPMNDIKGVKIVPQCESRLYNDYFVSKDGDVYFATGDKLSVDHTESDVGMADSGYISITPLTTIRTDNESFSQLKFLEKNTDK